MRIGAPLLGTAGPALQPRREVRPGRPDRTASAVATSGPAMLSELPSPLSDRLDWLMATDPALAQAINAQLPAARQSSARDLAAYVATARTPQVDISG
jgi:hypothetical protein